jgi:hypothetical protein
MHHDRKPGGMPGWIRSILQKLIKGRRVRIHLGLAQDELSLDVRSLIGVTVKLTRPRMEGAEFVTGLKPWWLRMAAVKGSGGQVRKSERVKGEVRIGLPPEAREGADIRFFQVQPDGIRLDLELKGLPEEE